MLDQRKRAAKTTGAGLAILVGIGLTACTDLTSDRVDLGTSDQAGHSYNLPMAQYRISINRTLSECDGPTLQKFRNGNLKPDISVAMTYETEIQETFVADPDETYTADYESLSSWTKTSSIEYQNWPNGTLKSINASADDQTGEIATQAIASAAQIALAVAGVPVPGAGMPSSAMTEDMKDQETDDRDAVVTWILDNIRVCKGFVRDALASLAKSGSTLKRQQADLEDKKAALEVAKLDYATHPDPTKEMRQKLDKAIEALRKAQNQLAETLRNRNPVVAQVSSLLGPKRWPARSKAEDGKLAEVLDDGDKLAARWIGPIPQDDRAAWRARLSELSTPTLKGIQAALQDTANNGPDVGDMFAIQVALEPRTGATDRPPSSGLQPAAGSERPGIYYRLAVPVRLSLTCKLDCRSNGRGRLIEEHDGLAPQFGPRMVLPLSNGAFQSNSIGVAFNKQGVPTKLTYSDDTARGAELASIVQEAATTLNAVREQARQSDLRELQLSAEEAEQRGRLLTAQQSNEVARELADLKLEKARLEAQVAVLQSQLELADSQAKLTRESLDSATADTVARTQLLQAKLAEQAALAAFAAASD